MEIRNYIMAAFTFEYDLYSDLHKDAYGFRPRGYHRFYADDTTDEERQEFWDWACRDLEIAIEEDQRAKEKAEAEFKGLVQKTIALGAGDEETALRWLVQDEEFYSGQDVEHYVWDKGILFTDYGRELVERLLSIVEFKEWERI
jgi:hypothetical protein